MGCYNPIFVQTTQQSINALSSDGELYHHHLGNGALVNCGKCPLCLQHKRDNYLVRCLCELDRSAQVFFLTLTYSNKYLPFVYQFSKPVIDDNGDFIVPPKRYKRSVWDKQHIQGFLKKLNERIIYLVGVKRGLKRLKTRPDGSSTRFISDEWKEFVASFPRPVKSLCVCERGKSDIYRSDSGHLRRGKSRPHYHLILFLMTNEIDSVDFMDLVRELWYYGLSYNIQMSHGKQIRDVQQSIMYVTKYVTKDIDDSACKLLYSSHADELRHQPFILVSNFLGDNVFHGKSDSEIIRLLVNGFTIPGTRFTLERNVALPMYQVYKSPMYHTFYDGSYVTKSIVKPEFFYDGYEPIPLDLDDKFEYHIYPRFVRCLTHFGIKVKDLLRKKVLQSLLDTHSLICSSYDYFKSITSASYSLLPVSSYDFITRCGIDELRNFVKAPYDDGKDSFSAICYQYLRKFISTLGIKKYKEYMLRYNANLDKVMQDTPELFDLTPI